MFYEPEKKKKKATRNAETAYFDQQCAFENLYSRTQKMQ